MIVKLLTERHLEFLSLKGGCRGSSESTYCCNIVGNHMHWLKLFCCHLGMLKELMNWSYQCSKHQVRGKLCSAFNFWYGI